MGLSVVLVGLAAVVPPAAAAPSAPGGLLVPSARTGPLPDLVLVDPDTGDARNLTRSDAVAELYPAYSPDGRRVAFVGRDKDAPGEVFVCDASGANPRRASTPAADGPTVCFAPSWSPDGKKLAYARGDVRSNRFEVRVCAADGSADDAVLADAFGPAWSPDGKRLAAVRREPGKPYRLVTTDPAGGNEAVLVADLGRVEFCLPAYSPDGSAVVYPAATESGWQLFLVPAGGTPRQLTHLPGLNANPVWVAADRLLFTHVANPNAPGAYATIKADGTRLDLHPLTKVEPGHLMVRPAAFVPRVPAKARPEANPVRPAGAAEVVASKSVRLVPAAVVPAVLPGSVGSVAWSADGKRLAYGTESGAVVVGEFDPARGLRLDDPLRGHDGPVTGVGFGAGGALHTAGRDGSVRAWDVARKGATDITADPAGRVDALAVSADGTRVAAGGRDGVVRVRDAAGKAVAEVTACEARRGSVQAVAFGKGDAVAFAGCGRWEVPVLNGSVTAFDPATGKPLWKTKGSMGGVFALAVSPDGGKLVGACLDSFVRVWDAATGAELACWKGHADRVTGVSVSPDGALVATCGFDHTVRVWDLASGAAVQTVAAHAGPAVRVAFAPDGQHLASTGQAGAVFVWKVVTE